MKINEYKYILIDMDVNTIYKNIDQELEKIFPKELVRTIGYYYCYKGECDPISVYDKVLSSVCTIGHDGYDSFGPESDLYDLYILYKKDSKKYVDYWHRENWFDKSDRSCLYYIESIYTLKEFMNSHIKTGKIQFNKFLPCQ